MGFFNFFSSHDETSKQPNQSEAQLEMDLFNNLSQTQKFAMVTMLASLAAAPADAKKTTMAQKMLFTDSSLIGISQDMMMSYIQTHGRPNPQVLIPTLKTITDTHVLEWLMYCGFCIISVNQNEKALYIFFDWWQQLGYEPEEVDKVVKETEAFCNKMRQLMN